MSPATNLPRAVTCRTQLKESGASSPGLATYLNRKLRPVKNVKLVLFIFFSHYVARVRERSTGFKNLIHNLNYRDEWTKLG